MDFEYSRDEFKCEGRKGFILVRELSSQNGEHFLGRWRGSPLGGIALWLGARKPGE